jgi:hypothetical protein
MLERVQQHAIRCWDVPPLTRRTMTVDHLGTP